MMARKFPLGYLLLLAALLFAPLVVYPVLVMKVLCWCRCIRARLSGGCLRNPPILRMCVLSTMRCQIRLKRR